MPKGFLIDLVRCSLFSMILILAGSWFVRWNLNAFNSFSFLSSQKEYTDLYYQNLFDPSGIDDKMVLINIGGYQRGDISRLLNAVKACKPKLTILDLLFVGEKDSLQDAQLLHSVADHGSIVLPHFDNSKFVVPWMQNQHVYFASNEFITDERGIVKYIDLGQHDSDYVLSQIASKLITGESGDAGLKEINYFGNKESFLIFEASEFIDLDNPESLSDKIFIIGYAGNTWSDLTYHTDMFYTPINFSDNRLIGPTTPGMVIHANVLKNVLDQNFIKNLSPIVSYFILFLLLLIANFFYLRNFKRMSVSFFLKSRLFQIVFLSVLTYLIFLIFHLYNLKLEWAEWMIALVGSFELSMIYVYIMFYLGNKYGTKSYIYKKLSI